MDHAAEQRALADVCWQFVALAEELAEDNAWIRRTVFGVDVFIQRFGGELRGFHNVCAHRGFPLRTAPAGVGPVACGFHGWGYGKDGVPNHIPRNAELFGLSREQRKALVLPAVRVEAIGRFVFACVSDRPPQLGEFLGPYADVYRAASPLLGPVVYREAVQVAASWRLHTEITLDDYHITCIHPTTFGALGELPVYTFVYRRDGLHSAYLHRKDADWSFDYFWRDIAAGTLDRTGYKIFNCFPGTLVVVTRESCVATAVYALAPDRCALDTYVLGWKDGSDEIAARAAAFHQTLFREDRETCERWQQGRHDSPVLGKLEERISWFRETLADVTRRAAEAGPPATRR